MTNKERLGDKRSDSREALPLNVRLEIAKQNKRLAEVRYKASVRRGKAWGISHSERCSPK
jgi:hypothetical protein